MKRFYLSVITLMLVLFANAQAVEKVEGFYYLVSPNAQYYAGAQEGSSAFRYSLATKEENRIDPEGDFGFKTNAIANDGTVAGSYAFKAALWVEGNNYEFLPSFVHNSQTRLSTIAEKDLPRYREVFWVICRSPQRAPSGRRG